MSLHYPFLLRLANSNRTGGMQEREQDSSGWNDDPEPEEDYALDYAVNILLCLICGVLLVVMMYIGYRVYKIVKLKDKAMLGMIFFLNLELMSKVIFYAINAAFVSPAHRYDPDFDINPVVMIVTLVLPVQFLSIAIIINLRNWIYYHIKIGEMAFHSQKQELDRDENCFVDDYLVKLHRNMKKYVFWLDITTGGLIVIDLSSLIGITIYSSETCSSHLKVVELITGVVFGVLAVAFGATGILILSRLQQYFPMFYTENKSMILFATFGLMISLLCRAVIDNIRYFSTELDNLFSANINLFNTLMLIFCDVIPILF